MGRLILLLAALVASSTVLMVGNAFAVVCTSVITHTAFSDPGPGGADNPVTDCSSSDTFLFTDALANIESPIAIPVFEGADWFTDLHISLPDATGGPTLEPSDGLMSFFRNVTDGADWLVIIEGLRINFEAPAIGARVDPGDEYRWVVLFSEFVDESALPLNFEVAYTMRAAVPEPTSLILIAIGLAALRLRRK